MIKIHAGKLKGQSIYRPHLITTKETASMVREAVFNSLFNLQGNVLDLFAGSGSYGICAYSFGANKIYFNEINKEAYNNLIKNINKVNISNHSKVANLDYLVYLKKNTTIFDYIFLDPPFNLTNYLELLIEVSKHTNDNSLIILELDKKSTVIDNFEDFKISKNRTYGSKRIVIYAKTI